MRGGEVLHEELLGLAADGSPRHSTALLAEVERAAAAAGGWDAVGRIAVGRGPGPSSASASASRPRAGLAASTGLPRSGVCTLDALGRALGESRPERVRLAVLDARRGEVFAALYAPSGERLWEPLVAAPGGAGRAARRAAGAAAGGRVGGGTISG